MSNIEAYEEPISVEENEEETTDYNILSLTIDDKIALGETSEIQTKLYGDRIESKVAKSDEIVKTFRRFNNNTARNRIISNIAILNYFEPLRVSTDPKMNSIYESILKIYRVTIYVEEAVQNQRLFHQRAINEISKIYDSGDITRQLFEKTFTNLTSLEESLAKLHAIDEKQLENFLEIKKEMDNNQSSFLSLTTLLTEENFINLSKVLASEVKIIIRERDTQLADMKSLLDEIEVVKKLTFETKREKFLLEKELKLYELKIENTIEVLKRLVEKRESIEDEFKCLEKSKSENNEKKLEARMETCRQLINEIIKQENIIKYECCQHETEKSHLQETKMSIEEKDRIHNEYFKNKLKAYDNCMIILNEKREKAIQALKDDKNFNKVLQDIAELGVVIKEDQKEQFRIDYKSFIQDFNMFYQEIQELPKNSEAITLLFDRLFAVCEFIRKQQTTAINIATGEELTNKMWPLFCEYFFNNQSPSEAQDAEMLKELIMSKLPKQDANDPKIEEAFKMIFDYESVRRIFASIEKSRRANKNYVEGFVEKMKEDIDEAIGDLKNQIDDLKENMKNEDDNEENGDSANLKKEVEDKKNQINEIKNSLAEKRKQKLKISKYGLQMRKIIRCLDQMINEVREKYLDARLKKSLESSFKIFQNTLKPQIDVLLDGFQSSDS